MSLPDKITTEKEDLEKLTELQDALYSDLLSEAEPDAIETLIVGMVKQAVKDDLEYVSEKMIRQATEKAVSKVEDDIKKDISVDEIANGIVTSIRNTLAAQRKEKIENAEKIEKKEKKDEKIPDYFWFGIALILIGGTVFVILKVVN